MKTKKLTPRNVAPVQRENTATISRDGNAMIALFSYSTPGFSLFGIPFAGDDAE